MALFGNDGGGTWSYYVEITSQNAQVDSAIDDVYVDLSNMPADFFTNVQDGGADIRVTNSDGSTELPREVVSCDTTASTGELHFDAGGLLSTSSDTTYRIYYGNASATDYAATDTYGRNNAWSSTDHGIWHGEESSGDATDSTGTGNTGTYDGDLPTPVSGAVGNAQDMDGTGDAISISHDSSISFSNSDNFSLLCFIKTTDTGTKRCIIKESNNDLYSISIDNGTAYGYFYDGSVPLATDAANRPSVDDGNWHLVGVTFEGGEASTSTLKTYHNGVLVDTSTATIGDISNTEPLGIGANVSDNSGYVDAALDEPRVIAALLSENEMATLGNILSDNINFWSVGSQSSSTYTISGTVTDGGTAVENAEVLVVYADDDQLTNATILGVKQTDASGNWSAAIPGGKTAFATAFHKDASSNLHVSTGHGYITEGS